MATRMASGLRRALLAAFVVIVAASVVWRHDIQALVDPASGLSTPYDRAVALARAPMDAARKNPALAPGDQSGDDPGGFAWRTHVAAPDAKGTLAISVSETWHEADAVRNVQLEGRK